MSKVVKGVKKVFKKVAKVVKKVAPIVLAVGAVVFTGGAALGLAGAAGAGWGAAAAQVASTLGATGTLGSVITGAITQAGYGAVAGGVLAELSGGDFADGMKRGALAGAVSGGVMGGLGMNTDPLSSMNKGTAGPAAAGQPGQAGAGGMTASQEAAAGGVKYSLEEGLKANTVPTAGGASRVGGLFKSGGWLERNQDLAGNVIKGLGQGLVASSDADALAERDKFRQKMIQQNYEGIDPGRNYIQAAPNPMAQRPGEKYDQRVFTDYEYRYNPEKGRIERVALNS